MEVAHCKRGDCLRRGRARDDQARRCRLEFTNVPNDADLAVAGGLCPCGAYYPGTAVSSGEGGF